MKPFFRKRIKWIGYGCLLIACFAIWQNWFVATHLVQSKRAFEGGDLDVVKTSLATVSPFAGSWQPTAQAGNPAHPVNSFFFRREGLLQGSGRRKIPGSSVVDIIDEPSFLRLF